MAFRNILKLIVSKQQNRAKFTVFHTFSTMAAELASVEKNDCYLYDISEHVSNSLELMYFDSSITEVQQTKLEDEKLEIDESKISRNSTSTSNECSTCQVSFIADSKSEAKRAHYKSDLHRLNLKRSINKLSPLNEAQFDELLERSSIESLSGSEDSSNEDDEDENDSQTKLHTIFEKLTVEKPDQSNDDENTVSHLNTKSPFLLFKSDLLSKDKAFGVYKSVFTEQQIASNPINTIKKLSQEPVKSKSLALFMIGGGHFAAAIISHRRKSIKGNSNQKESKQEQEVDLIDSKTFHRYTTRRKQGGSQSASDNARGKANSAGSSIRRYNEQALIKEVRELLSSWKTHLADCESIFIRANGASNRKILIGYEGSILQNNDPRIRSFPFTTKRATKSELVKAWVQLSYLNIVDIPKANDKLSKRLQHERENLENSTKQQSKSPNCEQDISLEAKHSNELINLLKKSKAPMLINYIRKNKLSPNFELEPKKRFLHHPTLLHFASSQGLHHMVQILLINLKCDPTITNEFGKTACELSANHITRKSFQISRFSLGEQYCDWDFAQVGNAKSKEDFDKEEEQNKKQESLDKIKSIEEELAKKTELELKRPTYSSGGTLGGSQKIFNQVSETGGLTEQQKLRLMREQRARAAEARFSKTKDSQ